MKICHALILFCFLLPSMAARAQFDPKKVCRLEDGRLIFTLDMRWNEKQRKEIARIFALDSSLMKEAFALKPRIKENNNTWITRKLDANHIELSKVQDNTGSKENGKNKIFLLDDKAVKMHPVTDRESVPYGVNRLTRNTVMQLSAGTVRFFLPGHREATSVFLSGSFNAWATGKTPMQSCDSGWVVTLSLLPGKYTYKFIVDGKWINDSYNKLREDDTFHGHNNVFFCYNHWFVLYGFPDAAKVVVTGSFNGWNREEIRMIRIRGSWRIPLFLREGTYTYKFIVDGEWITDPANKSTRPDGQGGQNSVVGIGDTLMFTLKGYPGVSKVALAGNFNNWNPDELFMVKIKGGWQLPYVLAPGNYEYKFIVDGEWISDPGNPYKNGNDVNSFLAVKPNHMFKLEQNSDAHKVVLTGSFNGWRTSGYRMAERDGIWYFPLYLKPGKYTYKYIVDNRWILDPDNDLWEENEYGTGNSVIWIESPFIPF
jgi:hypothetical protein